MARKSVIEIINSTGRKINSNYALRASQIPEIYNHANGDWFKSIIMGFDYGYIQGVKAAKAAKADMKKGGVVNE